MRERERERERERWGSGRERERERWEVGGICYLHSAFSILVLFSLLDNSFSIISIS